MFGIACLTELSPAWVCVLRLVASGTELGGGWRAEHDVPRPFILYANAGARSRTGKHLIPNQAALPN